VNVPVDADPAPVGRMQNTRINTHHLVLPRIQIETTTHAAEGTGGECVGHKFFGNDYHATGGEPLVQSGTKACDEGGFAK